jgi:hypothetical protein
MIAVAVPVDGLAGSKVSSRASAVLVAVVATHSLTAGQERPFG